MILPPALPFRIGSLEIGSRFFLAPINTGYASDGTPLEPMLRFHALRSGRGIGVTYVGNVAIDTEHRTTTATAALLPSDLSIWTSLATAISDNGSIPAIQLACRLSPVQSARRWVTADKESYIGHIQAYLSSLDDSDIESVCYGFVKAARIAAEAGFKIIQIHAAHGYLLALLLNRRLNTRSGKFAASSAFALDIIATEVLKLNPDLILDVRISLWDGIEDDPSQEREYRALQVERIAHAGFHLISLSAGMYDVDRNLIYPIKRAGENVYLNYAKELAQRYPSIHWNVAGNLRQLSELKDYSLANLSFGIGRPLIADPDFISKTLSGRQNEINTCDYSGHCHYFSRGRPHLECRVNEDV